MFEHRLDDRTTLRLLEVRHAEEVFAAVDANRRYLRQWMPWVDGSRGPEDMRAFIRGGLARFAADNGMEVGIWHDGAFAGTIGMHAIDRANRKTSLGYWLGERFQGQGIMTRACTAMIDQAFGALALNRVEIRCATANTRSQAIPERLGFRREGVVRETEWLYDRFLDHVVFGMLASEWRSRA